MEPAIGPAIGVVFAFSFAESLLALWRPWQQISLSGAAAGFASDLGRLQSGIGVSFVADIPFGQALAVLCGWAVVGVVLAVWGLQIRDP